MTGATGPGFQPAPVGVRLGELASALGLELLGNAELMIQRIGPLDSATPGTLGFLANPRYRAQLATTQAGAVIVSPECSDEASARGAAVLLAADPYLAFARLTQWWARRIRPSAKPGVHASAAISEGVHLDASASVGAFVTVEAGAFIGAGAVIGPHCHLGAGAVVGEGTRLYPRVVLGDNCRIGARGIVHPGAVIGADGFGFAPHAGEWVKIEQLGGVRIGDDVEIGANACIDRGALDDTVVEDGVKLDNMVQIAHNVHVGAHTAMAGSSGIAGSTRVGRHCTVGGAAVILGHLRLVDHVRVSAATVISRSILQPGHYSGFFPFDDNAAWEKNAATLRHLHALRDRIRTLEKKTS